MLNEGSRGSDIVSVIHAIARTFIRVQFPCHSNKTLVLQLSIVYSFLLHILFSKTHSFAVNRLSIPRL